MKDFILYNTIRSEFYMLYYYYYYYYSCGILLLVQARPRCLASIYTSYILLNTCTLLCGCWNAENNIHNNPKQLVSEFRTFTINIHIITEKKYLDCSHILSSIMSRHTKSIPIIQ